MNRLIKVIYINILNLFDINKIMIAKQDGVKSSFETKTVITGLVGLLYGYLIYRFFTTFELENKLMILAISFLLSTLICFVTDLFSITPVVLKGNDNNLLFSMPLSVHQVLFSKLFQIYLKNLLFVGLFMISGILSYGYYIKDISDTFLLMFILVSLVIPFIPMILSTIISYIASYYKLRWSKAMYYLAQGIVLFCLLIIVVLYFKGISYTNLNDLIKAIYDKMKFIYPLVILFYRMLSHENVFYFICSLVVPGVLLVLFNMLLSNRYLDICSKLNGIGKKKAYVYHRSGNLGIINGFIRKELCNLLSNKTYLWFSLGTSLLFTVIFFVISLWLDPSPIIGVDEQIKVFNARIPSFLAMLSCFNVTTIVSVSLEKKNLDIIRTLPIRTSQMLFSKWAAGVICGTFFVLVNGVISWYYFKPVLGVVIFNFVYPLYTLMFVCFTGLFLDYRFVSKNTISDSDILKGRMINMVPTVLSVIVGIVPLFLMLYAPYYKTLASYMLIMFIFFVMEIGYIILERKKLEENLYS